ncbi:MAG: proline--tRNA ligase [Patescibacteria group bacterium]|nr:MAG: proline--tRNA ligase [Patescibacteria group bacterium]
MEYEKKELKKKSQNLSDWYTNVVIKAELADYGPVRGTIVIRPYGYAIWENIQAIFNRMMRERKKGAIRNAYFPLFIPYSYLKREKEHVEGFSPELALVTIGGGEELPEPLVVRPTSETIMYEMYAKWIKSWRDLPLLINQWNNVVRWEKRTFLFLRTLEFLWQEGHTAHATESEAEEMALEALEWYRRIYEEYLALPVLVGVKSEAEKFAGAKKTWAVEALMPDGKALQGATSHNLGQNFSKVFDITFQDKSGKLDYVWQTSWGLSTRSLGGMFLSHGDDHGLVIPPKVAPFKVAIIPIFGKNDDKIIQYSRLVSSVIAARKSDYPGEVIILDNKEDSFGRRVNDAEIKGIPLKIEIGARELEEKFVTLSSRLNPSSKRKVPMDKLDEVIEKELGELQKLIFKKAKGFLEENTTKADSYEEFKKIMKTKRGFIKAYWCEDPKCEKKVKEETKATTRVRLLNEKESRGKCIVCGKPACHIWYFGQSY